MQTSGFFLFLSGRGFGAFFVIVDFLPHLKDCLSLEELAELTSAGRKSLLGSKFRLAPSGPQVHFTVAKLLGRNASQPVT